ncbi:MAG: membrane dipeptidase [Gemmatimonadota bacterium]
MADPTPPVADDARAAVSRRTMLRAAAGTLGAALGAPFVNLGRFELAGLTQSQEYTRRCIDLVTESLVIDMLGLTTLNSEVRTRWGADFSGMTEEDIQEFRDSEIDVLHIARGIGGRTIEEVHVNVLAFVAQFNSIIANRPDVFVRIDSADDLAAVHGSERTGILIGIQDSAHFRTVEDVDLFYQLGQRVGQLTYNSRNMLGNGATERMDGGVSDFGVQVIDRMNTLGMAVDVSHCGDNTTLDACEISRAPVLFTHSNVRALAEGHPRCKTDEAIVRMAETGGVMGITGVRMFVSGEEPTTIEHFLDHFDHVRDLVGVEHLGIGSDIDLHGYDDMPPAEYAALKSGYRGSYAFRDKIDIDEIAHPKRMFDVTDGLIRRGYTDEHIRGILGGNFQRVLGEIWAGM